MICLKRRYSSDFGVKFNISFLSSTSPEEVVCITSASDKQRTGRIKMNFDFGDRYFDRVKFEYVEDPTIESAESGSTLGQVKIPKGIPAGGIRVTVTGKNLAYIQNPQMYADYENKTYTSVSIP